MRRMAQEEEEAVTAPLPPIIQLLASLGCRLWNDEGQKAKLARDRETREAGNETRLVLTYLD